MATRNAAASGANSIFAISSFSRLVQQRQIGTQHIAGSSIHCEKPVNDPIIELVFVCRHDNNVEFPCRNLPGTARLGVSILQELNLLDVLCNLIRRSSIRIALQYIDCFGASLQFRKNGGSMSAAKHEYESRGGAAKSRVMTISKANSCGHGGQQLLECVVTRKADLIFVLDQGTIRIRVCISPRRAVRGALSENEEWPRAIVHSPTSSMEAGKARAMARPVAGCAWVVRIGCTVANG